jgi:hypothetical protein
MMFAETAYLASFSNFVFRSPIHGVVTMALSRELGLCTTIFIYNSRESTGRDGSEGKLAAMDFCYGREGKYMGIVLSSL